MNDKTKNKFTGRKIIQVSDKVYGHLLREKSEEIKKFDEDLNSLINELFYLCKSSSKEGVTTVGLSAPQIGVTKRVFIYFDLKKKKYFEVINPRIKFLSKEMSAEWEGCASIGTGKNTLFGEVERPEVSEIEFYDKYGERKTAKVNGYQSHVFLHEIDHLEGILFTDHVKDPNNLLNADELDKYMKKYDRR